MLRGYLLIAACLFVLGCAQERAPQSEADLSVIMVTNVGGLGDKGFNDASWKGCQEAQSRLAEQGVTMKLDLIESRDQTDYGPNLTLAAERADLVVGIGFMIADALREVAQNSPQTQFLYIDGQIDAPNVASYAFRGEEGGMLAGILATSMTQSGVIAAVPGMEIPPVMDFERGYRYGAQVGAALQGKAVEVLSSTIGSFNDPVKGRSVGQSLLNQEADVLFQLAGNSGLGVIEAVQEAGSAHYVIGVDIDQDDVAPGVILTSVLKRMDRVVADKIVAFHKGEFETGAFEVGLKEGYISLTDMRHTKDQVPADALEHIEQAKQLISEGAVTIPAPPFDEAQIQQAAERFRP